MVEGVSFLFTLEQLEALHFLMQALENGPEELAGYYSDLRDDYYEILDDLREEFAECYVLVKEYLDGKK